ncbi:hypothetical protein ABZS86_35745 [Streptomyces sp. NPDC005355]|uniref:hypothetical protein n=1 Tax=unclassified Streptomyces TaxID=2593676 RepID=UPI0033A091A7
MQIAKKAALLAATAGTLVLLGTGTAAACDGDQVPPPSTVRNCSVNTGDIYVTSGDTTTGDVGDNSPAGNNTVVINVSCFNTPG